MYDGDNVLASYASNGTLNARYITAGVDENLSMTRSGNTYYYMADGLGSIRNIGESDEDTANTYDYYAFGNTLGTETQRSPSLNRTRIGRGNRSDDRG